MYKLKKVNYSGNGLDLHSILPKFDMTPPGYIYAGANNPLHKQIQLDKLRFNPETGEVDKSSIIINPGNNPRNELDAVALLHDCEYHYAELQPNALHFKHLADARLLKAMKNIKSPTLYQKIMEKITKLVMGTKYKLGLGVGMSDILNEVKNANTQDVIPMLLAKELLLLND